MDQISEYDEDLPEYYLLDAHLPLMVPDVKEMEVLEPTANTAHAGTTVAVGSNLVTTFFKKASANLVWSCLNALQMIVHTPLFNVSFPANANAVTSAIIEIAAFDFFESLGLLEAWMYFPDTGPLSERFERTGYETKYFILNMGTVFFMMLAYLAAMILFKLVELLLRGCNTIGKGHKYEV